MKTIFIGILSVSFLLFTSCKKDEKKPEESNGGTTNTVASSMKASIDGVSWTSATSSASINAGVVTIQGISSDNKKIRFTLNEEGKGSYALTGGLTVGEYLPANSETDIYTMNGVILITSINTSTKKISGSFSGTASNGTASAEITAGVFENISYTGEYTGAGNSLVQMATADLDMAAFNPTLVTGNVGFGLIALNIARNSGSESIGISFDENTAVGSYTFGTTPNLSGTYSSSGNPNGQYAASTGNLIITSNNTQEKNIKGTFDFVANPTPGNTSTNMHTIQNGTFSINY